MKHRNHTKLTELSQRAERASAAFTSGREELYRTDGEQLYSDTEHQERLEALAAERDRELDAVRGEAERIRETADNERTISADGDPAGWLDKEALEVANARRQFALDDAEDLSAASLSRRCQAVLAGKADTAAKRGALYAWYSAASKRLRALESGRGQDSTAPGRSPDPGADQLAALDETVRRMKEALRPQGGVSEEELTEEARHAGEVSLKASNLQHGARTIHERTRNSSRRDGGRYAVPLGRGSQR